MLRPPPRSTRTDTLFPDTTLFRSKESVHGGIALRKGAERYPQKYPLCSRLVPYPPGFDRTVIAQKSAEISRFLHDLGRPRQNKWCPEADSNLNALAIASTCTLGVYQFRPLGTGQDRAHRGAASGLATASRWPRRILSNR